MTLLHRTEGTDPEIAPFRWLRHVLTSLITTQGIRNVLTMIEVTLGFQQPLRVISLQTK